jgi:hypothetical protein
MINKSILSVLIWFVFTTFGTAQTYNTHITQSDLSSQIVNKLQTVSTIAGLQAYTLATTAVFDGSVWIKKSGIKSSNGGSYAGTVINVDGANYWERQFPNGFINPQMFGAKADGTTDDSGAMQLAVNSLSITGGVVYIFGSYKFNSTVTIPSNVSIIGRVNAKIYFTFSTGKIFDVSNKTNVRFENIYFEALDNAVVSVWGEKTNGLKIYNCETKFCRLFYNEGSLYTYASVDDTYLSRNIDISNNICNGNSFITSRAAIEFYYCKNAKANFNTITNYRFGIQFWGGDATHTVNGALTNTRWASNLSFTGNVVNTVEAGIWGSMGIDVSMTNNNIKNCTDVGLDVEGTFFANIQNNNTENCGNGGISTFFYCKGISITGNTVYSAVDGQMLLGLYNASQTTNNKDVSIKNNTFTQTGTGIGIVGQVGDNTAETIVFQNNTLNNVKVQFEAHANLNVIVSNNILNFTNVASVAFNAIKANAQGTNPICSIEFNKVISTVTQPAASAAIYVFNEFYNGANTSIIEKNNTSGFPIDIKVFANSGNAGYAPKFLIRDNILGNSNFLKTTGTTNQIFVVFENNKNSALTVIPNQ